MKQLWRLALQVLDIVPTKQQDEIIIALHENDYDVGRTIEFLLEGGDVTQDWVTAGNRGKTAKQASSSPNQTAEEAELTAFANHKGSFKSHKNGGGGKQGGDHSYSNGQANGSNGVGGGPRGDKGPNRSRDNRQNGGVGGRSGRPERPPRRTNEFDGNGNDVEDKMGQLDLNENGGGGGRHKSAPGFARSSSGGDLIHDGDQSQRKRGNGTRPAGRGVRSGPGRGGSNSARPNGRGGRNGGKHRLTLLTSLTFLTTLTYRFSSLSLVC